MRIAQITLPTLDNDGASLADTHANLAAELVALYQGFTVWDANGAWQAADGSVYYEAVKVYQIFIPGERNDMIREIATRIGREARQLAMAIVIDGRPEVFDI